MSILEVKNLSKSFGSTEVLKDISFTLEKGDVLSIIGSSGSGKTTILRCINQLETADSGYIAVDGEVFFDGRPAYKNADEKRKKQLLVGLVFQNFNQGSCRGAHDDGHRHARDGVCPRRIEPHNFHGRRSYR